MRRLVWCVLALAAACGSEKTAGPAPLTGIRQPTGVAVHHGRVLVLSSNADLLYDEATGGSLLALQPDPTLASSAVRIPGGVNVHSMGGDLAVARTEPRGTGLVDAEACGTLVAAPVAVFGTRGSNTLNAVVISDADTGALSCTAPGARCGIPVAGTGFGDPLGVAVACGGGRARAYFGYLNDQSGTGWIGELDLADFTLRAANLGSGPVRAFAYDRDRDRLFMTGAATGYPTPLRWLELSGCTFGAAGPEGCALGSASLPVVTPPFALELHGIALAHPATPGVARGAGEPIRAYLTALVYDQSSATTSGYRTTAFGSLLLVVDLLDDAAGGVTPRVAAMYDLPPGAQLVQVLPRLPGWPATRRDVVAVVSSDTGSLTILDDETGTMDVFGLDATGAAATGAPILGHQAYGLGVDPAVAGSTARVWVGGFADGWVSPIDVTLDPVVAATFAGGAHLKITGATP